MNNTDNKKKEPTFLEKFFEVIAFDESPDAITELLNTCKNELSDLSSVSNDEIDREILQLHLNYCKSSKSTPYEGIPPSSFPQKKAAIEEAIVAKTQLLHAFYRIQYHYSEFTISLDMLKKYLERQTSIRVQEEIDSEVNRIVQLAIQNIKNAQQALNQSRHIVEEVAEHAKELAQNALYAKDVAASAKDVADKASKNADKAKQQVDNAEKNAEINLSKKTAEVSVTILGIFAGIVLTIVAGLFYSSSVLESIDSANIYRLVLISSVVGFVCINIIAIMFNYIDKFRSNSQTEFSMRSLISKHLFVLIADILLIVIMVFTWMSASLDVIREDSEQSDVEINANVNISEADDGSITSSSGSSTDAPITSMLPKTDATTSYTVDPIDPSTTDAGNLTDE